MPQACLPASIYIHAYISTHTQITVNVDIRYDILSKRNGERMNLTAIETKHTEMGLLERDSSLCLVHFAGPHINVHASPRQWPPVPRSPPPALPWCVVCRMGLGSGYPGDSSGMQEWVACGSISHNCCCFQILMLLPLRRLNSASSHRHGWSRVSLLVPLHMWRGQSERRTHLQTAREASQNQGAGGENAHALIPLGLGTTPLG